MPDTNENDITTQDGQVPPVVQPDGQVPPVVEDTPAAETFSKEYVQQLRAEAAENRKRAKDAEEKLAQRQRDDMSDLERATAERDQAKAEAEAARAAARESLLRAEVTAAAVAANAVDPETVRVLVSGRISFDDDGQPVGVHEAVTALLVEKPYLVKTTSTGGGSGNGHAGRGQKLTADMLRGMTSEQIAALPRADVDAALAAG